MNHGVFQSEYQNREHKIMLVSEYEAFSIGKVTNTRVAAAHITAVARPPRDPIKDQVLGEDQTMSGTKNNVDYDKDLARSLNMH